jgi:phosphoglucosamine mutase
MKESQQPMGEEAEPLRFGTSGIRGVVGQGITEDGCWSAGRALGTLLGQGARVCLGRDTRLSGPAVAGWVVRGLLESGADVVDLGVVPTPALAALTRAGGFAAGVMLTASHNPPEYNGIKVFDSEGVGFARIREQRIEELVARRDFSSGHGCYQRDESAIDQYIATLPGELVQRAAHARIPLLLDPGNGAASGFVRTVFERLGLPVSVVNDEPDGAFPGRGPEPAACTLCQTCEAFETSGARLCACYDGDADRVVFCDPAGFIGLDEMVAFVASMYVRNRTRRCLATTVETGLLPDYALADVGGRVVRGTVGDVAVAHLVRQEDAGLGAETVGVYIFPEVGLYPESIVATLQVCAMLGEGASIRGFVNSLPRLHLIKRKVACPNSLKQPIMSRAAEELVDALHLPADVTVNTMDGLRLEMPDAWVLVRPSGTEPVVRVTAEAVDQARAVALATDAGDIVTRLINEAAPPAGTEGGSA